jgi:hypothetical protein
MRVTTRDPLALSQISRSADAQIRMMHLLSVHLLETLLLIIIAEVSFLEKRMYQSFFLHPRVPF